MPEGGSTTMEYKTKTPRKTMSAPPVRWKKRVEDAMDNDDGEATATAAAATTDDIEDDTSPKRNWKVKRILSNDSFKRENPGSLTVDSEDDGTDDDDNEEERKKKKSYKVKRILSNDSFKRENQPRAVEEEEPEEDEDEHRNKIKKKAYKVKRILSNDSFKRENTSQHSIKEKKIEKKKQQQQQQLKVPTSPRDSTYSTQNTTENDGDGVDHTNDDHNNNDGVTKPQRQPYRHLTTDKYWEQNKSMNGSTTHSATSLSVSLHGDVCGQDDSERHENEASLKSLFPNSLSAIDDGGSDRSLNSRQQQQRRQRRAGATYRKKNGGGTGGGKRVSLEAASAHVAAVSRTIEESTGNNNLSGTTSHHKRSLMKTQTSHEPLKKGTEISKYRSSRQHYRNRGTGNSVHSESSSASGLDNGSSHSITSFASNFDSDYDYEEEDRFGSGATNDGTDSQAYFLTPQPSQQTKKKGSLANRINMFERLKEDTESTNLTSSVLSPRYLEEKDKDHKQSPRHSYSRGSLRALTARTMTKKSSDPLRSPRSTKETPPPVDSGVDITTPRANNATKTYSASTPKTGCNSLKEKISMFNKNSSLPEFMNVFGSHSPAIGQKKLVVKPPLSSSLRSKSKGISGTAGYQKQGSSSQRMSLKELLPPPKQSLDATNTESVRRKVEKMNNSVSNDSLNDSFNRRGRVKAAKSALLKKNDQTKRDIFTAITAPRMDDLSNFQPPEFNKDSDSIEKIHSALRQNFVFKEMNDDDRVRFVKAFEEVVFEKGQTIIKQGDAGDYFYVIGSGEVLFEVNKKNVGSADQGGSFGEVSLLYTCPRAASVIAGSPSTKLYRVDQRTFRFMMQSKTKELEESKRKLLRGIKFLEQLSDTDLLRLSSVMKPCMFGIGDYIVKRGEKGDSFYIIHEGKARVTDIVVGSNRYEDVTLHTGDYFGEGALIAPEVRTGNVVALTKGSAFSIDRSVFERVLGNFITVIQKAQDRRRIGAIKVFREAELSAESMDELASLLMEKKFEPNETIFDEGNNTGHALYLVREGTVNISSRDGSRDKTVDAGGFFGQGQLLADVPGKNKITEYTAVVGNEVCVCSVLTLKQCRTVFDTTLMEDVSFRGRCSLKLERRARLKESIAGDFSLESLEKIRMLGDGQFAEVWLVQRDATQSGKKTCEEYALKIQDGTRDSREDARESVIREAMVLQQLHHPFIVDLIYSSENKGGTSYMVTEVIYGGELWSVIHREKEDGEWISGIEESHAKFYTLIIADALAYMHRESIIFRDLKPENVLMDEDGWPVIIDMGFAKHVPIGGRTFTFCGTPNYVAPEIVQNIGHGRAVDHWALGIVVYEMVTGENPFYFEGMDQISLFKSIVEEPFFPLTEDLSGEVEELLDGLLEKDPIHRLGSLSGGERDILRHHWFDGMDLDKIRNKEIKAPWVPKILK
mmetsp:Transcript_27961/g.67828  ORF Transcript_27961/g.67828 Transcript_27961/m.67828 type:complete len:1430 (-) Transcript_27961:1332-5621(-)